MDKLKTLVIDDSAQIREFVVDYILKPHGFEVDTAVDGAEGLRKALDCKPDLILTDFEMPRMDGLEFLRAVRKHDRKVPIILMTSHGSEQIAVEVFRLGVQDYIIKPFSARDMLQAINDALSVTHLEREKEALTRHIFQANQQLKQHLDELNALYEVGKSIAALMQPNKLVDRIVSAVLLVTRCEECALTLVDPNSGKIKGHLRKQRSDLSDPTKLPALPATGKLVLKPIDQNKAKYLAEKVFSVPLRVGQKVFGTLSISKRTQDEFTPHDDRLLHILADYSAIALHNMQLVHQLQLTKEQEKQQIRGLFERYVAPSVVAQLLTRPDKVRLGGARQAVTILFADVRGFSAFSAQISPETLVNLLNQYMQVAAEAILAQEGTLDKFMGDAVMAFFNAPLPQPDHVMRAIRAAWRLGQSVKQLHQRLPAPYRLEFGIGVGLGDAIVGNIGTAQMMNYTVIGDSVNKVKRLQENAQGGQILISRETYDLVQEGVEVKPVGNLHLKGQNRPEPVYEVVNLK